MKFKEFITKHGQVLLRHAGVEVPTILGIIATESSFRPEATKEEKGCWEKITSKGFREKYKEGLKNYSLESLEKTYGLGQLFFTTALDTLGNKVLVTKKGEKAFNLSGKEYLAIPGSQGDLVTGKTFNLYGQRLTDIGWWVFKPEDLLDPDYNIVFTCAYWKKLRNKYPYLQAISAYNAGRPIQTNRSYVDKVLANKEHYMSLWGKIY